MDGEEPQQLPFEPRPYRTLHIADSSYFLDDAELAIDFTVSLLEEPPLEIAERLVQCYMTTIHKAFPILSEGFEDQFKTYCSTRRKGQVAELKPRFRAIMNLVFAIGARYSHLVQAKWCGDDRDHPVYMQRATQLFSYEDGLLVISNPSLNLVQGTGLLSIHLLIIGHVSRA